MMKSITVKMFTDTGLNIKHQQVFDKPVVFKTLQTGKTDYAVLVQIR